MVRTALTQTLGSIVLSILASAAATFMLRQILSASSAPPGGEAGQREPSGGDNVNVTVVIMPISFGGNVGGGFVGHGRGRKALGAALHEGMRKGMRKGMHKGIRQGMRKSRLSR
jgi:hypothetical protein